MALASTIVGTVVVHWSSAAAGPPAYVQGASASNSGPTDTSVSITVPVSCAAGDTLIAMVTIAQDASSHGGLVSSVPSGWQRLYEHSPSDDSPYQGWFALPGCPGGPVGPTFVIASPGNAGGTSGTVVVGEYSGLPSPLAVDFSINDGSSTGLTSRTLPGQAPSAAGELVLTALSVPGSSLTPSPPLSAPWNSGGSSTSGMAADVYWQLGTTSAPTADYSWSPASPFEVTMLALKAGGAGENVVQENQGTFPGSASWSVSLPGGVAQGHALVALVGTDASVATGSHYEATGVSGGGVAWQQVAGFGQSGNGTVEVWVGFDSSGTSGPTTVTADLAGTDSGHLEVAEVAGITAIDTAAAPTTASGSDTFPTAATLSPTADDFLVAFMRTASNVLIHPQPLWSTFSLPSSNFAGEWQADAPGGASGPGWTTAAAANWVAVQAAFVQGTPPAGPVVTALSPNTGPAAGGSSVTIMGTNLAGTSAVHFGTLTAPSVTVTSASTVTAVVPPGSGTVPVTVTGPGGTSAPVSSALFTYRTGPAGTGTGGTGPGSGPGYRLLDSGGHVYAFGTSYLGGATGQLPTGTHAVHIESTPDRAGYWVLSDRGGVYCFGDASYFGGTPTLGPGESAVSLSSTPDGGGYWLFTSSGRVLPYGDARYFGSLAGVRLNGPVVSSIATPSGGGYYIVASDGGVFAFGDARFEGSMGGARLNGAVVGLAPDAGSGGYWLDAADGGIFAFGGAPFGGSMGGRSLNQAVVGMIPYGDGYLLFARDGGIFDFSSSPFAGSLGGSPPASPVVSVATG